MRLPSFFPSRTVVFYMSRLFLTRTFAILFGLVLVLQSLDLLSESGKILAHPGNGQAEVWRYVSLRTPQIIARFLPFSVLLGTILTLSTMNQNSEVIALKAAGLSAQQVLAPLVVAAFGLARSGKLFVRAVIGMALGFAYFVADNFALAMGNLGAYPPFLAAWAPFLLFLMIGQAVLIRTEE